MAVEGGLIKVYITDDLTTALPDLDDATTSLTWTNWTELTPVEESISLAFLEESQDVVPLSEFHRTQDHVSLKGLDTITGTLTSRSAVDLYYLMSHAKQTTVASASSQVGKTELAWDQTNVNLYRRLAIEMKDENGMWNVLVANKVRFTVDQTIELSHEKTQLPFVAKCFTMNATEMAAAGDVLTDERCWVMHDMTAAAA